MKEISNPVNPVLLVDDEVAWLRSLTLLLERSLGINNVMTLQDSREVPDVLARLRVSLVVLDMTMPHRSGEEVLSGIMRDFPEIPVIIHTGRNEVDIAVRCMKLGAFDYFVKTSEQERLLGGIRRALALTELKEENLRLKQVLIGNELKSPEAFSAMTTNNPEMKSIFRYAEAISASHEPVMITGESGVGKELIARAIHRLCSPEGPWQAVNVAGLDDNVFSDTLFGHVRGAYTGADQPRNGLIEQAAGGVLFLDEIGDLSHASQVKLLRLLQEGEYFPLGSDRPKKMNVRVVAATNHNLEESTSRGVFRKDLFYRLKSHHIRLPSLRERREDIPLLLDRFLTEAAGSLGRSKPTPPPELFDLLGSYDFPGNIRELRSMVFDAISQHHSGVLSMRCFEKAIGLPPEGRKVLPDGTPQREAGAAVVSFSERLPTIKQAADLLVQEAMTRANGNQTLAAKLLGISRPALIKRLRR